MFALDILVVVTVTFGVKILLKCTCVQEVVVQLGDVSRGFARHAGRQKVIILS